MIAKGSDPRCCCGGCGEPPLHKDDEWGTWDRMQAFCCACVPIQLCVTFTDYENVKRFALLDLMQPCDENYLHVLYEGTVDTGVADVDVQFSFFVDEEAGKCFFHLESDDLDISGDIEVTPEVRDALCRTCGRCCEEDYNGVPIRTPFDEIICEELISWEVEPSYNAPMGGVITACPADNVAIPPCDECLPICSGCPCVCGQGCIKITHCGDIHTDQTLVELSCEWTYQVGELILSIVKGDYDDECCHLEVTQLPSDIEADEFPEPIRLADGVCPDFSASWLFTDPNCYEGDNDVLIEFTCAGCGECPLPDFECCPCPILDTLYLGGRFMFFDLIGCASAGGCRMDTVPLIGEDMCTHWEWNRLTQDDPCTVELSEDLTLNFQYFSVYCLKDRNIGESFVAEAALSNLGCGLKSNPGDPAIRATGQAAKYPDSYTCLSDRFLATFTFELEDGIPGGCGPCSTPSLTFDVEIIQP